jgi:hypothetical protein
MPQPKPKKIGRPKLPKGEAKGRIVPIRFNPADLKRIESMARASQQTVSEWIRGRVAAVMEPRQATGRTKGKLGHYPAARAP